MIAPVGNDGAELLTSNTGLLNDTELATASGGVTSLIVKSKFDPQKKRSAGLFTERERQIIQLICRQHTAQEIGVHLFLSKRTVEGYRTRILEKMDVKNTAGVVVFALKHNLIREEDIL